MKGFIRLAAAGALILSLSVPVYADKSAKTELPAETTDYYMTVDSGGVGVDIYPETDSKSEKLNGTTIEDGTVLHIEGETEKNGENWGYTEYKGGYGYVPLDELRPSKDEELAQAGITGKETAEEQQQTPSATETPFATETPSTTETPSAIEIPVATETPSETQIPSETQEPSVTQQVVKISPVPSEDAAQKESKPVNGTAATFFKEDKNWYSSPFLWIGVVTVLAVIGIFGYHLKKR